MEDNGKASDYRHEKCANCHAQISMPAKQCFICAATSNASKHNNNASKHEHDAR